MKKSRSVWLLIVAISISVIVGHLSENLKAMTGNALTKKIIIVDPGHGGFDPGKPGIAGFKFKNSLAS